TQIHTYVCVCVCVCVYHFHARVSQSPRHRVTKTGKNVVLRCDPFSGHSGLYWYRQTLGQGLEFLMSFQYERAPDKSGMCRERFSAGRPQGSFSTLQINSLELGDSATYLCASSLHSPAEPLALCTLTFLSQLRVF
uniref:Ig-like domain-containing protein n=1 Tax=Urocitellus parryii TaxID=9999 RepID=A0A8D2H6F6_UROPR